LEKALYIFLGLYFVPVAGIAVELHRNFPPSFTLLAILALVWTADGLGCIVMGIAVFKRHVFLLFDKSSLVPAVAGLFGILLGLIPTYILVELISKLVRFLYLYSPVLE